MKLLKKIINRGYYISPIKVAEKSGVKIGEHCRLLSVSGATFGSESYLVKIGNCVTITSGVKFITYDGGVWIFREDESNLDVFGDIIIGNNVFIGLNTLILPSTRIGDNTIIEAGSIVKGEYPPDVVIAEVPGQIIKGISAYKGTIDSKEDMTKNMTLNEKEKFCVGNLVGNNSELFLNC